MIKFQLRLNNPLALDNIGHIDILQQLFSKIIVTPEISKEFGKQLPDWVQIINTKNRVKQHELSKKVDSGEASAIALAIETSNSLLIIDEKKGRTLAKEYEISILGTLKIILKAKQKQIIPQVRPLINLLLKQNFRIDKKVIDAILVESNEI